jgi:hypothetical protein
MRTEYISIPPIEEKVALVQRYIFDQKGVNVNIIFNNPFVIEQHMYMLDVAYLIAREHYELVQEEEEGGREA